MFRKYITNVAETHENIFRDQLAPRWCSCWQRWRWFMWRFAPSGGRTSSYFSMGEMPVLTSKVMVWDTWWQWLPPSPLKIHPVQNFPSLFPITLTGSPVVPHSFLNQRTVYPFWRGRKLKSVTTILMIQDHAEYFFFKIIFSLVLLVSVLMYRRSCIYN